MEICRNEQQTGDAMEKINFCLNKLEKEGFVDYIDWDTQVTPRLTMEELVGALVHVSQEIGGK